MGSTRSAIGWLAVVVTTFVAGLVLLDAPPVVAYAHYRFPRDMAGWAAGAAVVTSLLLLLTVGRSHVTAAVQWARRHASPAALAILVMAVVGTSAVPSREPRWYAAEALFATLLQFTAALGLVALVRTLPATALDGVSRLADRLLGPADLPGPTRPDAFAFRVAVLVAAAAATLAVLAYGRHPHVPDEVVYLLQARYLAEGLLTMPPAPVPAAFNIDLMHYDAHRWFSPVPPGWPFVLAAGAWLGVPWLVNPVLAGVVIVVSYPFLGAIFDRRTTRLALLLLATSPWFLFMSMNFMTHTLALLCAVGAGLGVARSRASGRGLPGFAAGLCTGAVSLIRPLEGLAVAALAGLWSLGARGSRFRFGPSAWLVAGTAIAGALVMPYNKLLSGEALRFPLMAYIDKYYVPGSNDMGFGANRGLGWSGLDPFPGHGAIDVVVNALLNLSVISGELLGWSAGAMLVIGLLVAGGKRRLVRGDWWMLAVIAVVAGSHTFYWFSGGPDFGARYWYLAIVPCVALAARSVRGGFSGARAETRATAAALVMMLLSVAVYVPWRAAGKYHDYRAMRPDVRALTSDPRLTDALVLVRGRRHPDYASAAIYNPIDLRAPGRGPVFAWDATPAIREAVVRAYPWRPVWILDGPSITGEGFRVAAGPLTADEALASPIRPTAAGDEQHAWDPVYPPEPTPP